MSSLVTAVIAGDITVGAAIGTAASAIGTYGGAVMTGNTLLGNPLGLGGGAQTGTTQGGGTAGNTAGGAIYDPFGPNRQMYTNQLNTIMANPTAGQGDAAFMAQQGAANQATQRSQQAQGTSMSGGGQLAMQQQNFAGYNAYRQQQIGNLSALSGAASPMQSVVGQNQLNQAGANNAQTQLGQAFGSLSKMGTTLGGIFPTASGGSAVPGYTGYNSTGAYTGGGMSPVDTSGSGGNNPFGYQADPNMGGGISAPPY